MSNRSVPAEPGTRPVPPAAAPAVSPDDPAVRAIVEAAIAADRSSRGSKSDRFRAAARAAIAAGDPVAVAHAARSVGIGYGFAYGIAARTPVDPAVLNGPTIADRGASRRDDRATAAIVRATAAAPDVPADTVRAIVRAARRTAG